MLKRNEQNDHTQASLTLLQLAYQQVENVIATVVAAESMGASPGYCMSLRFDLRIIGDKIVRLREEMRDDALPVGFVDQDHDGMG